LAVISLAIFRLAAEKIAGHGFEPSATLTTIGGQLITGSFMVMQNPHSKVALGRDASEFTMQECPAWKINSSIKEVISFDYKPKARFTPLCEIRWR